MHESREHLKGLYPRKGTKYNAMGAVFNSCYIIISNHAQCNNKKQVVPVSVFVMSLVGH